MPHLNQFIIVAGLSGTVCFNGADNSLRAAWQDDSDADGRLQRADKDDRFAPLSPRNDSSPVPPNGNTPSARKPNAHLALGVIFYDNASLDIRSVVHGSPAAGVGLRQGDEVLSVNGQRVSSVTQLIRVLDRAAVDEPLQLGILRNARRQLIQVTLAPRRAALGPTAAAGGGAAKTRAVERDLLGVTLDDDGPDGVRITGVYRNGPAETAGLRRGDEIVAVDGIRVRSNPQFARTLSQTGAGQEVALTIERDGRLRTVDAPLARRAGTASNRPGASREGRRGNYTDGEDGRYPGGNYYIQGENDGRYPGGNYYQKGNNYDDNDADDSNW